MIDALFETLNDTHHAALRSLADLFNIIPKNAKTNQPEDIMDVVVGRNSFQLDQIQLVCHFHIDIAQNNNNTRHYLLEGRQKRKTWYTSKVGTKKSASCNTGVNKSHVPNNSNRKAKYGKKV